MDELIQDICTRLPYGLKGEVSVEVSTNSFDMNGFRDSVDVDVVVELLGVNVDTKDIEVISCDPIEWHNGAFDYTMEGGGIYYTIDDFIPYLRPMSSMTEEECIQFTLLYDNVLIYGKKGHTCILNLRQLKWLNEHHFDYNGLIEKGLAKIAPEGIYG